MLECLDMTKVYRGPGGGEAGIRGVTLRVVPGELVVVRGPSGCGKSTLLMTLGGMLRPDSGQVRMDGVDVYGLGAGERAALRSRVVGFVFQLFHLVPYLTVRENVMAGLGAGTHDEKGRADGWIEDLGLGAKRDALPATLSAGERQRAALARALAKDPRVVLADEPTGNLDPANARAVFERLDRFRRSGGTVLVVTHGTDADPFATRVIEARGCRAPFGFGEASASVSAGHGAVEARVRTEKEFQ